MDMISIQCDSCDKIFYDLLPDEIFEVCPSCGSRCLTEHCPEEEDDFGGDFDDAGTFRSIGWGVDEDYGYAEDVL